MNLKVRCAYLNIIRRYTSPNVGAIFELSGHQNILTQIAITELGHFLAAKNHFFITNGTGNTLLLSLVN